MNSYRPTRVSKNERRKDAASGSETQGFKIEAMGAKLQLKEVPKQISMTLPPTLYEQVSEKAAQMNIGIDETIAVLLRFGLAVQEQREAEMERVADDFRSSKTSHNQEEKKRLGDELGGAIFGR